MLHSFEAYDCSREHKHILKPLQHLRQGCQHMPFIFVEKHLVPIFFLGWVDHGVGQSKKFHPSAKSNQGLCDWQVGVLTATLPWHLRDTTGVNDELKEWKPITFMSIVLSSDRSLTCRYMFLFHPLSFSLKFLATIVCFHSSPGFLSPLICSKLCLGLVYVFSPSFVSISLT